MKKRIIPVKVHKVRTYPNRPSPYVVRWPVNGAEFWRSFKRQGQAINFHATLIVAIDAHERFSNLTGLPYSLETSTLTGAKLAKDFVTKHKHLWEAKTRQTNIVPLAEMLICLVTEHAPDADMAALSSGSF